MALCGVLATFLCSGRCIVGLLCLSPMSLIPQPCCPRCGSPLPVVKAWWHSKGATTQGLYLAEKTGVICPDCGERLVLLQGRAVMAGILGFISMGATMVGLLWLVAPPRTASLEIAALAGAPLLLACIWQFRVVPRFCQLRPEVHGERVNYPLSRSYVRR